MEKIELTWLEDNILSLHAIGITRKDIIQKMEISEWLYKKTMKDIKNKLQTDTLIETVVKAVKQKYIAV